MSAVVRLVAPLAASASLVLLHAAATFGCATVTASRPAEPSRTSASDESPGSPALATPPGNGGPTYHLGAGAGIVAAHDSGNRFGEVYGSVYPAFIFDLETRFPGGWFLNASGEYGSTSGREVLINGEESETSLSLFPAHFSAGKLFDLNPEWQLAAAGGATISTYREINDLVASDGTRVGGHGLAGIRWHRDRWSLNGAVRYTYVPDGLEDRMGGPDVVDRLGLSYLTLSFTAQYQIWPHGSGAAGRAGQGGEAGRADSGGQSGQVGRSWLDPGRFLVQIYGAGVIPTGDSARAVTRVRYRTIGFDSSFGFGAGFRSRLTGPLGVGIEFAYARPTWRGTAEYPNASSTFLAEGKMDQKMVALGLDLHLLDHGMIDLYATPLVSYLSYVGSASGEYNATVDRQGYSFGLGLGADIGPGHWVFNTAFKHLSLARISGFESGFNARPILLTFGMGFRF